MTTTGQQPDSPLTVVRVALVVIVGRIGFRDSTGRSPEELVPAGVLEHVARSERLRATGSTVHLSGLPVHGLALLGLPGRFAEVPVELTVQVPTVRWQETYGVSAVDSVPVHVATTAQGWSELRLTGSVLFDEPYRLDQTVPDLNRPQ